MPVDHRPERAAKHTDGEGDQHQADQKPLIFRIFQKRRAFFQFPVPRRRYMIFGRSGSGFVPEFSYLPHGFFAVSCKGRAVIV